MLKISIWAAQGLPITTLFLLVETSIAIPLFGGKEREFFQRLEESMEETETFQSDVTQESRYSDGVVQRYSGKLAMTADGRVAYHYDLEGQYQVAAFDPGDLRESEDIPLPSQAGSLHKTEGSYFANRGRVRHYDPERRVLVETTDDENVLIQVFRALIGSGEFDLKKFRKDHRIEVTEEAWKGEPAYKMVAIPKDESEIKKRWTSRTRNQMLNWNWELWVMKSNMQPVKAVLQSDRESTSVALRNTLVNQGLDESLFHLNLTQGKTPGVIRRHNLLETQENDSPDRPHQHLPEIKLEQ